MPSTSLYVLLFVSLAIVGCSSEDPSLQRRGGPVPSPSIDGTAGESPVGVAGAGGAGELIRFCEALTVIRAKCQRCHQQPPLNGAPVPFLTYDDTQAPYGSSEFKYFEVMLPAVEEGRMPYVALNSPPTSIMPPVEPLTDEEKATLVGWLMQGARPEGGTACP
jgi:hypothetical protein